MKPDTWLFEKKHKCNEKNNSEYTNQIKIHFNGFTLYNW